MINLFINWYEDKRQERQSELVRCLLNNLDNKNIDRIFSVGDTDAKGGAKHLHFPMNGRPTYADFFKIINEITEEDDINIIANTDIYFDETIAFASLMKDDEVFALCRWDVQKDGSSVFYDHTDSQDTWVFRGPIRKVEDCNFTMGRAGCDNAIAERLERAGYKVSGPSKSIKTFHLHLSGIRNYSWNDVVAKPYKLIPCTRLETTI